MSATTISLTDTIGGEAHFTPDVRMRSIVGRPAAQCTSAHGKITIPCTPLHGGRGHVTLWFTPLEELSQHPVIWRTAASNLVAHTIPLLSDHEETAEHQPARFCMHWAPSWGHPFFVKFAQGRYFPDMHTPEPRYCIEGWIESLRRHQWYRVDVAFDHHEGQHTLWINGIVAGRSNQHGREQATWEEMGKQLFLRSPQIGYGSITLHEKPLTEKEVVSAYAAEAPSENHEPDIELRAELTGSGNPRRELDPPDSGWQTAQELDLCQSAQASHFHLQGQQDCLHWEPEGLRIATTQMPPFADKQQRAENNDPHQMYLWSREVFEGDIYIAYDFMPLQRGGLSILIPRASGMQGEDFMQDYPLRSSGSMKTIHSSDLRLYHWEFFREMDDTRNDVPTHAIVKWPWERTLAGGVGSEPFRIDDWNRIEFLQQGEHIQGAVNGEVVIEGYDKPYAGHGPVLRHGHLAIRCMVRTDVRLRNLTVKTRS